MLLKSFSLIRVVIRTSVFPKLVVNGCSLISCLPASKSKCNCFTSHIPHSHYCCLGNDCRRNESSTCGFCLILSKTFFNPGSSPEKTLSRRSTVHPFSNSSSKALYGC